MDLLMGATPLLNIWNKTAPGSAVHTAAVNVANVTVIVLLICMFILATEGMLIYWT